MATRKGTAARVAIVGGLMGVKERIVCISGREGQRMCGVVVV